MAYSAMTTDEVTAGAATKQETGVKIKDNFTDHETRISAVEASSTQESPIVFAVKGGHYKTAAEDGVAYLMVPSAVSITSSLLIVLDAGGSGSTTVDIQKSAAGGASFSTIYTVTPTVAYDDGDYATDAGTLDGAETGLDAGDILRLDLDEWQVGSFEFQLYLEFEIT